MDEVNSIGMPRKIIAVIPVGFDRERVMQFPGNHLPHCIYLVTQKQSKQRVDHAREYVEQAFKYFHSQNIPVHVVGSDNYFDMFKIMAIFRIIADKHRDEQVIINVGSGSKLSAMAGMLIAGMYDNVSCYYPKMNVDRGELKQGEVIMLPVMEISRLEPKYTHVLGVIESHNNIRKKDLLELLIQQKFISSVGESADGQVINRSQQALFNDLKRNYLNYLFSENLITEENNYLKLQERGRQFLVIFGGEALSYENVRQ